MKTKTSKSRSKDRRPDYFTRLKPIEGGDAYDGPLIQDSDECHLGGVVNSSPKMTKMTLKQKRADVIKKHVNKHDHVPLRGIVTDGKLPPMSMGQIEEGNKKESESELDPVTDMPVPAIIAHAFLTNEIVIEDEGAVIEYLSLMSVIDYERVRDIIVYRLKIRGSTLDKEVSKLQKLRLSAQQTTAKVRRKSDANSDIKMSGQLCLPLE